MEPWGRRELAFSSAFRFWLVVMPAVHDVVPYSRKVSGNVSGEGDLIAPGIIYIKNNALLPVPACFFSVRILEKSRCMV